MVKSDKVYSPQHYLKLITGNEYVLKTDNPVEETEKILENLGYCLWTFDLREIEEIIENDLNVILVEYKFYCEDTGDYESVYRWSEVDFD